jgi:GH24 family phage-related lysozyme (muramidase)
MVRAIGQYGLDLIVEFEGFAANPYNDPLGYCTGGYGHLIAHQACSTLPDEVLDPWRNLTETEARRRLGVDVQRYATGVEQAVTVHLNQNQFDALVSFTYNVGVGAFQDSTLLRLLNSGNYNSVPVQLRRWIDEGSDAEPGLRRRREAEIRLWNTPVTVPAPTPVPEKGDEDEMLLLREQGSSAIFLVGGLDKQHVGDMETLGKLRGIGIKTKTVPRGFLGLFRTRPGDVVFPIIH